MTLSATFGVNLDTKKIQHDLQENAVKAFRSTLKHELDTYFQQKITMQGGQIYQQEGVGRTLVKELIQERLTSEKMVERMSVIIEENFDAMLKECITDAMRHQIRKKNFNTVSDRTKEAIQTL